MSGIEGAFSASKTALTRVRACSGVIFIITEATGKTVDSRKRPLKPNLSEN